MEEFHKVLREFRALLLWPLGSAGLGPVLAQYSNLLPVNFLPIVVLSSVGALVSVCCAFFFRSRSRKLTGSVLRKSAFAGLLAFLLFLVLFFQFTYQIDNVNKDRIVLGCGWAPQVVQILGDFDLQHSYGCPGEAVDEILDDFNHQSSRIWSRAGLSMIQIVLGLSFFAFFVSLSVFLASFVIFNSLGKPQRSE